MKFSLYSNQNYMSNNNNTNAEELAKFLNNKSSLVQKKTKSVTKSEKEKKYEK